jgi:U3 small nucleolar RNA-associated protein 10
MGQALQQLQALNLQQLREQQGPKAAKAGRAAAQALYDVFKAMQGLLDAGSYLAATLQLVQSDQDKARRRALRLFAERLAALQASLDSEDSELSTRVKERRLAAAAGPALQLCQLLPGFLSATGAKAASAMTRQAALLALEPVARMYGGQAPEQVLGSLPSVLAAAADKGSAAVRASALACTATIVKALGPKIVGQLPATAEAVLAAVARVQQQVSSKAAAPAADSDEEQEGASAAEEAALELSSGLAAVDAMVRTLGAFVSPYLPRLLQNLLQPAVLACKAAGCSAFAAEIRAGLPAAIPARLLLQPLFDQWEHAAAVAAAGSADVSSAVALLGMVSSAASHMDSKSAAAYHEQFFAFLLTALDTRQQRLLPAASPALLQLEASAVQALVALVMKLSEARFKPLFLRLLDWAAPASGSGPGRVATLLACADAITARLRSVFVPYFKHLQDICIQQLTGSGSDQQQPKKKRKKGADATAAAAAAGGAAEDPEAVLTGWLARMRALRALHRCLLHDTVSFLDQDRFQVLLPPLVAQLDAAAPADVLPVLAEQCAAADLEAGLRLGARTELDALRTAAVACLTQMAITGNSDTLWKPLNHQALMVTRSGSAASRLAGLEVLAQLVGHLNEEFISLIPETIPFLAELVEDSEAVVEARTQEVVKLLEEASGEKLDQYMR